MTKVRADLLAVARVVLERCADLGSEPGTLVQAQIDAAIGLQAREKFLSQADAGKLVQLRSQLFKSPQKKLRVP